MSPETVLLRQVHPNFIPDGALSSQAFFPFPKDDGRLSVYDGDQTSAADAYAHYTTRLNLQSAGMWGVSNREVGQFGLFCQPDPLPGSPAHAYIKFEDLSDRECRKLAKKLKAAALTRGCLFTPV